MSFKKWQKLMAAKTPNAVAPDLPEETRVAGLTPVWLDTPVSLAVVARRRALPVSPCLFRRL
jgi:hypothetical protein